MIHESKDGLAGNGCADGRTQAAQHMGLHQTALAALPVVPAACRGADAVSYTHLTLPTNREV